MVPEKVKSELKRFLSNRQVEDLSKQLDSYEKRVREAVKHFDVKGREAKALGQERLDKFTAQVKRTSQELEKQLKSFVNQEGKVLNKGLNELFTYFRGLTQKPTPVVRKASATKSKAKSGARKAKSATRATTSTTH
jgi:biopolymer transport protein ExbB/TolQ